MKIRIKQTDENTFYPQFKYWWCPFWVYVFDERDVRVCCGTLQEAQDGVSRFLAKSNKYPIIHHDVAPFSPIEDAD